MRAKENSTQPMISGAVSLPLPNIKRPEIIYNGTDDIDVCLNCDVPAERCKGGNKCYRKHKKKKDKTKNKKGGNQE